MDEPVVAEAGEMSKTPPEELVNVSEVKNMEGNTGVFIEWQHRSDCWMYAKDDDSFVMIDDQQ
jgi:hypothetical protein